MLSLAAMDALVDFSTIAMQPAVSTPILPTYVDIKAADVFGGEPRPDEPTVDLKVLHAKIGQLALENDFLEGALIKAGMLSAKR